MRLGHHTDCDILVPYMPQSCEKLMKSRASNRNTKLKICRSLIRTVVTYGCEAWTLTNQDEQLLRIFERKMLRKMFGPV